MLSNQGWADEGDGLPIVGSYLDTLHGISPIDQGTHLMY